MITKSVYVNEVNHPLLRNVERWCIEHRTTFSEVVFAGLRRLNFNDPKLLEETKDKRIASHNIKKGEIK